MDYSNINKGKEPLYPDRMDGLPKMQSVQRTQAPQSPATPGAKSPAVPTPPAKGSQSNGIHAAPAQMWKDFLSKLLEVASDERDLASLTNDQRTLERAQKAEAEGTNDAAIVATCKARIANVKSRIDELQKKKVVQLGDLSREFAVALNRANVKPPPQTPATIAAATPVAGPSTPRASAASPAPAPQPAAVSNEEITKLKTALEASNKQNKTLEERLSALKIEHDKLERTVAVQRTSIENFAREVGQMSDRTPAHMHDNLGIKFASEEDVRKALIETSVPAGGGGANPYTPAGQNTMKLSVRLGTLEEKVKEMLNTPPGGVGRASSSHSNGFLKSVGEEKADVAATATKEDVVQLRTDFNLEARDRIVTTEKVVALESWRRTLEMEDLQELKDSIEKLNDQEREHRGYIFQLLSGVAGINGQTADAAFWQQRKDELELEGGQGGAMEQDPQ